MEEHDQNLLAENLLTVIVKAIEMSVNAGLDKQVVVAILDTAKEAVVETIEECT